MSLNNRPSAEPRSCKPCHTAKRKCDRTTPSCHRCTAKKLNCAYPTAKQTRFVPICTPEPSASDLQLEDNSMRFAVHIATPAWDTFDTGLDLCQLIIPEATNFQANTANSVVSSVCGAWFSSPETWIVDHNPFSVPPEFQLSALKYFLQLIQNMLQVWVASGSNPFIHPKLYCTKFPASAQSAYTTLSAYSNRSAGNTEIVLRIVNSQAIALMGKVKSISADSYDILEQLADMHALFVYQTIGLLDGDIHSRHLAEQRLSLFSQLLDQMLEGANKHFAQRIMEVEFDKLLAPTSSKFNSQAITWQSWILSESIRRTWLIGKGLNAAYQGVKEGWISCAGDIPFTSLRGVWEAETDEEWARICVEQNVLFTQRFHAEWIFEEVAQSEVDDFARIMFEITYGRRRMQSWS